MKNFNKEDYELATIIVCENTPGNYWIGSDIHRWTVLKETDTEIELFKNDSSQFIVLNKRYVVRTVYVRKLSD